MALRKFLVMLVLVIVASHAVTVVASELTLVPTLRLAEEYNDNIFESRTGRQTDFITHIKPGVKIDYLASRLAWNLAYAPEYLKFAHNSSNDKFNQYLSTEAKLTFIEKRLFLKASDQYSIISTNVAQDIANSGSYNHRTSLNLFSVSPYAEFHPDSQTLLTIGNYYNKWSYGDSTVIGKSENGVFLSSSREISNKTWFVADARYSYVTPDDNIDFIRSTLSAGIKREYALNSYANLEGGYTFFSYKGGKSTSSPFWNVGLRHDFGATTGFVSTGVSYDVDPSQTAGEKRNALARLENRTGRGFTVLFFTYDDYHNNFNGDTYIRRYGIGIGYDYRFTSQLSGNFGITADNYSKGEPYIGLPYYTTESVGLKYAFPYDMTASLTYSYLTWSEGLWNGNNSIVINRVMLELLLKFPSMRKTF